MLNIFSFFLITRPNFALGAAHCCVRMLLDSIDESLNFLKFRRNNLKKRKNNKEQRQRPCFGIRINIAKNTVWICNGVLM